MSFGRFYRLIADNADVIGYGIWITIQLAIVAMLIAVVVGLIACMGSLSRSRIIRFPSVLFVEFGRNTPILVQLIWVHFAWPEILGIKFSAWTSAVMRCRYSRADIWRRNFARESSRSTRARSRRPRRSA